MHGLTGAQHALQAIDPAQFDKLTMFTMFENGASGAVQNLRFRLETWGGGFEPPGRLVQGKFR